jgi:superfamily I DNA/RNA helicase
LELSERDQEADGNVLIGTMHLAKGLEFKAVAVMACDDGVLPLQSRLEAVADETELDDVYETERHLFYVACTRARDRLLITAVRPTSEFIQDLQAGPSAQSDVFDVQAHQCLLPTPSPQPWSASRPKPSRGGGEEWITPPC